MNVLDGTVIGQCMQRHRHQKFIRFLNRLERDIRPASWSMSCSTTTNRRLRRGMFHSLVDLQAAINRYLAEHNQSPKPFVWTADPDAIIAAAS